MRSKRMWRWQRTRGEESFWYRAEHEKEQTSGQTHCGVPAIPGVLPGMTGPGAGRFRYARFVFIPVSRPALLGSC